MHRAQAPGATAAKVHSDYVPLTILTARDVGAQSLMGGFCVF